MASPKTLEKRVHDAFVKEWLKGYYVVKHPLNGKGKPYVKHCHPNNKEDLNEIK